MRSLNYNYEAYSYIEKMVMIVNGKSVLKLYVCSNYNCVKYAFPWKYTTIEFLKMILVTGWATSKIMGEFFCFPFGKLTVNPNATVLVRTTEEVAFCLIGYCSVQRECVEVFPLCSGGPGPDKMVSL